MTEVRLRARSVSEIVDAAFALYRRDSKQYILVMAVATVPQLVASLLLQPSGSLGTGSILIGVVSGIISMLTYTVANAAITKLGAEVYLGQPADLEATVRSVVPKVGTILWAGFMMSVLFFLGFLAFFIGVFYVAARWFAVAPVIVLENTDAGTAFARSSALTNGRKRHVLNTLLLVWIIYLILTVCVSLVGNLTGSPVLEIIIGTAFQVVAYPVVALTGMMLYYDCRIRGEGFDIERMAASLDMGSGAPPGAADATT